LFHQLLQFDITHNKICNPDSDLIWGYETNDYYRMKPTEYVQLHPICVLSHLLCACKHCNIKLSLYYWTHWNCWWIYHIKI